MVIVVLRTIISGERYGNQKDFVAYVDVTKAFDLVWIAELFYQMYRNGIIGHLGKTLNKSCSTPILLVANSARSNTK